jgi:large subunit ribosomal protein L4
MAAMASAGRALRSARLTAAERARRMAYPPGADPPMFLRFRKMREFAPRPLEAFAPLEEPPLEAWVTTLAGERVGIVELDRDVFGEELRRDVIHRVVLWARANRRIDHKHMKNRAEVHGSGRKPFPQKGQGRAPRGSLQSAPGLRKGGKAMRPGRRVFSILLPKKVRALAMRSALSAKYREGNLIVLDAALCEAPQARAVTKALEARGLGETSALVIDSGTGAQLEFARSVRANPRLHLRSALTASVENVVGRRALFVTLAGLRYLTARLTGKPVADPHPLELQAKPLPKLPPAYRRIADWQPPPDLVERLTLQREERRRMRAITKQQVAQNTAARTYSLERAQAATATATATAATSASSSAP